MATSYAFVSPAQIVAVPPLPSRALAYIGAEFAALLAALGLTADAITFGASVSAALRALGATAEPVPTDAAYADYLALLDYYALRTLARAAAARVDVRVGVADASTSKTASQLSKQIADLLATALAEVRARGLDVGGGDGWSQGAIGLDFLEPQVAW